jgi:hypothetical protein
MNTHRLSAAGSSQESILVNIDDRTGYRRMLPCAMMGLTVSVPPCFAQGNRQDASQELRHLQEMLEDADLRCRAAGPAQAIASERGIENAVAAFNGFVADGRCCQGRTSPGAGSRETHVTCLV